MVQLKRPPVDVLRRPFQVEQIDSHQGENRHPEEAEGEQDGPYHPVFLHEMGVNGPRAPPGLRSRSVQLRFLSFILPPEGNPTIFVCARKLRRGFAEPVVWNAI
jgi:hypothetical protein